MPTSHRLHNKKAINGPLGKSRVSGEPFVCVICLSIGKNKLATDFDPIGPYSSPVLFEFSFLTFRGFPANGHFRSPISMETFEWQVSSQSLPEYQLSGEVATSGFGCLTWLQSNGETWAGESSNSAQSSVVQMKLSSLWPSGVNHSTGHQLNLQMYWGESCSTRMFDRTSLPHPILHSIDASFIPVELCLAKWKLICLLNWDLLTHVS